jgi:hypothetical protein
MAIDPEGILAITFIFGGGSLFLLALSPAGKALADRIRHGTQSAGPAELDPGMLAELEQLRQDVTELQERVDFTERLLAQKASSALQPGEERT